MPSTHLPLPITVGIVTPSIIANPGAGVEFSFDGGDQVRYRVLSLRYTFVASGTSADRIPGIQITIGGVAYQWLATDIITAGQTRNILWLADGPPATFAAPPLNYLYYRLPFLEFDSTMTIESYTPVIQVGDTFTNIRIIITKWDDPAI